MEETVTYMRSVEEAMLRWLWVLWREGCGEKVIKRRL